MAALAVLGLSLVFSPQAILNGAWRIPYLIAGTLASVILIGRLQPPNDKPLTKQTNHFVRSCLNASGVFSVSLRVIINRFAVK